VLDEERVGGLGLSASIGVLACPGASNVGAIRRGVTVGGLEMGTASEGLENRCSSLSLLKVDKSLDVRGAALSSLGRVADILYGGRAGISVKGRCIGIDGVVDGEAPCAYASIGLR